MRNTSATTYDSFGNTINQSGTKKSNLGFQSKYQDHESGLYYYYHRYYNPSQGRFINEDPIGLNGGLNLYGFVFHNPIKYIDPFGYSEMDVEMIYDTYKKELERMTRDGERSSSFRWNGVIGTLRLIFGKKETYKSCVAQEFTVRLKLIENKYEDNWTFEEDIQYIFGLPIHTRGKAYSDNPNDPLIIYDPFKDKFIECRTEFAEWLNGVNSN